MKKTVRQDYYYPNIELSLIRAVELCVSSAIKGGAKVYTSKKDFIVKAIQNQIIFETNKNKELEQKILALATTAQQQQQQGGNSTTIVQK